MELVNFVKGLTEVVDFTREVDGKKSLLSAVALRSNQVKYFPMELLDYVKGLTEVVDFTREVDSKKSLLSAVALRSNQVKYFPMELVNSLHPLFRNNLSKKGCQAINS